MGIDQIGNSVCRDLFNATLINQYSSYMFGRINETISSVLGKNQRQGTLSGLGEIIVVMLDWLDPGHCEKSIQHFNS